MDGEQVLMKNPATAAATAVAAARFKNSSCRSGDGHRESERDAEELNELGR